MTIHLDHTIIPLSQQDRLGETPGPAIGVSWAETGFGPFAPVFVNDGLTLDFIDTDEDFPMYHLCFRVAQNEFDSILARIKQAYGAQCARKLLSL